MTSSRERSRLYSKRSDDDETRQTCVTASLCFRLTASERQRTLINICPRLGFSATSRAQRSNQIRPCQALASHFHSCPLVVELNWPPRVFYDSGCLVLNEKSPFSCHGPLKASIIA